MIGKLHDTDTYRDYNDGVDRGHDVVIIGAGIAGLIAAQTLTAAGLNVVVVEQSKVVGGRLATQPLGAGQADTGAQFFSVRSAEFAEQVEHWLAEEMVYEWSRGWSDGSLATAPQANVPPKADGYPRYAAYGGFAQLAQHLADGLVVRLDEPVKTVSQVDGRWEIPVDSGTLKARGLLLTPPVPQSLALLDAGGVTLPPADRDALEQIAYAPCLCGLFVLDGEINLPEPGVLQRPNSAFNWLADNQRKGISPHELVLTVHASPAASTAHWDAADRDILAWLADELRSFLHPSTNVIARHLQRWPYALPVRLHLEPVLVAATDPPLAFAGDAFGSPRVEGAYLSGLSAAEAFSSILG